METPDPLPGIGDNSVTLIKGAPEIILEKCTHFFNEDGQNRTLYTIHRAYYYGYSFVSIRIEEEGNNCAYPS